LPNLSSLRLFFVVYSRTFLQYGVSDRPPPPPPNPNPYTHIHTCTHTYTYTHTHTHTYTHIHTHTHSQQTCLLLWLFTAPSRSVAQLGINQFLELGIPASKLILGTPWCDSRSATHGARGGVGGGEDPCTVVSWHTLCLAAHARQLYFAVSWHFCENSTALVNFALQTLLRARIYMVPHPPCANRSGDER